MVTGEDRVVSALNILALNSGSYSLKFGLYRVDSAGAEKLLGETLSTASTVATVDDPDAMTHVASGLAASGMPRPDAIGHRVVHGGPALRQHCRIDDAVLRQLQACNGLSWIGVSLDAARNRIAGHPVSVIHDGASRCQVHVLAAQRNEQIARHTWALLA